MMQKNKKKKNKKKKRKGILRSEAGKNLRYILVYSFVMLVRIIPRSWGLAIGRRIASTYFRIGGKQKKRAIANLRAAFAKEKPEREILEMAKSVFSHFGAASIDAIRIPVYVKKGFDQIVTPRNFHYAREALSLNKGAIFVTAHFGNWELMGAWLASRGYPIRVVATPISDHRLDKLIVDTRNEAGYYNIARGKSPKEIIRAIQKGYSLGFLIDQDTDVKGVFVDFFGMKAHTATGPALLASRYKLPVLPAFAYMKPDTTYVLEFFPPLELVDTGNPAQDVVTNTQRISCSYESMIRRFPEQWAWMHKRWKKQPEKPNLNPAGKIGLKGGFES